MHFISGVGDHEMMFEEHGESLTVRLVVIRSNDQPLTDNDLKALERTGEFLEKLHAGGLTGRRLDVILDETYGC